MVELILGTNYPFKTNRVLRLTETNKLLKSKSGVQMDYVANSSVSTSLTRTDRDELAEQKFEHIISVISGFTLRAVHKDKSSEIDKS